MLISYPILPSAAFNDDEDAYLANVLEGHLLPYEGTYPASTITTPQGDVHRWHGGVHLHGGGEPIRAIADGAVVAFRFSAQRETYGTLGDYDTSFVLLRHETQTGENSPVVFYSLYMHLANQSDLAADRLSQLPAWLRQAPGPAVQRPVNQRIWRKDVLGFAGQLYNREAMHFEVFMVDADFQRVWRDSSAITEGTGSNDWFGDAHFVIPPGTQFVERHPRAATSGAHRIDFPGSTDFPLPLGRAGQTEHQLLVSVRLQHGRRSATTYNADGRLGFEQLGASIVQDDYEYELYRLATALYPDCPSAGLEWLRFGRVLGSDTTTRNENWQLVRYGEDPQAIGYIDLAPQAIAKLSDADFPHWHGWERRDEGDTANASDGICDDEYTLGLMQRARDSNDPLGPAARKLQHLICKAPSEWDDSDLATRYARMRAPGQPLESDDNWQRFVDHAGKLAFWSQAGLVERSVWHFHPLRFIQHFRKCGWLSNSELAQCLPRSLLHLRGTTFHATRVEWQTALSRAQRWGHAFNKAARKYLDSRARLIHLFSHVVPETGYLKLVKEIDGEERSYAPYFGRGLIQLTHLENYRAYGEFKNFPTTELTGQFENLGWNPNRMIAENNSGSLNQENCADSAGFYLIKRDGMLRHMDAGTTQQASIVVSKDVNGYVAIENLNGLDARLQAVMYLREVLLDKITTTNPSLTFDWRRNSQKETVYDSNGNIVMAGNPPHPKKKFYRTTHTITVSLERQRPR